MIYKNSRYTKTSVENTDGISVFKLRKRFEFNTDNAVIHQYSEGDSLEGIALNYYNDPQLWWVILEANPQVKNALEVPYGTNLVIPSEKEVVNCLLY